MILDTNAISAFADGEPGLLKEIREMALALYLPVVALGEFRYGLTSSRQRAARARWLDELETNCAVLEITSETSRVYAEIRHELRVLGRPIPENDIWIAALARCHRLPVLSIDRHFDQVSGLRRVGW
ncbi:MAG: type II toxin-antitoxin system VapC family toxin [Verrucomicrobia bacterium]|nr:type II toxin-antitoxin system VapC family toxin [Verrucomicrobiota bacterium]